MDKFEQQYCVEMEMEHELENDSFVNNGEGNNAFNTNQIILLYKYCLLCMILFKFNC